MLASEPRAARARRGAFWRSRWRPLAAHAAREAMRAKESGGRRTASTADQRNWQAGCRHINGLSTLT